jgi:signal peptidase I
LATVAKRKASGLLENVKTILYAALIAIGIRTFLLEPFNIPSGSMVPTLLVGDYLFVSKYSYGYSQYSMPFSFPPFSGRIFGSAPARGDVVVFRLPRQTSVDYIKRIIGLPHDRIQVRGGQLFVNGEQVGRVPDGQCIDDEHGFPVVEQRFIETLPNGVKHPICKTTDEGFANNTQEYVVPDGDVFAMGDNRDNSQDSRFLDAVGFVPMENLVGRAEFIFFSIDAQDPWWKIWRWPAEIRWGRLFNGVR